MIESSALLKCLPFDLHAPIPLAFITSLAGFGLSFLITLLSLPFIIKLAHRFNILDTPDGKLKNHKAPTPYLGGLAILLGILSSLVLCADIPYVLLFGSCLACGLGLVDDIFVLQPLQKFLGCCFVALIYLLGGLVLAESTVLFPFNYILTFLWIVSVMNALNLVDIMDGLATTIAMGACFSFFALAFVAGSVNTIQVIVGLIGSLCAFFVYNRPPARIYLGDAGSLFLGAVLAAIPFLEGLQGVSRQYAFIFPIILCIPLLELSGLIVIRTIKGIPFYKGSPDHFAHYLMRKQWSKLQVLAYVVLVSSIVLALSTLFALHLLALSILLVALTILIFFWFMLLFF